MTDNLNYFICCHVKFLIASVGFDDISFILIWQKGVNFYIVK